MKFLKPLFIVTLTILFTQNIFAQIVEISEARQIAEKVFSEILSVSPKSVQITNNTYTKSINSEPVVYVFNETNGGFVIISAERKSIPVLAYSNTGSIDSNENNWNPEFAYWMTLYFDQIEDIRQHDLSSSTRAITEWSKIDNNENLGFSSTKDVPTLMSTTWSQGCGYNALCPVDAAGPCGRVYTGCVATAMAQVIRHIEHPVNGVGDKCYTHWSYGELCADFAAATYDYSTMTNSSGNAEVAELIYHCGVAVNMNYSPTGSGAYSSRVLTAYRAYFDLTNCVLISRNSFDNADWDRILRNEIDNNRPFYYSGSGSGGHAFVFDGYQNTDYFHVNWGWGGSYDGYFYCDDLTPGSHNYTNSQTAIIGTIPTSLFTGLDVSGSTNLACASVIGGDISTGTNYVNYYKNTYPTAVGKELVYDFTTTLPGRIRVKIINNIGGDVNVFLLSHAHQDSLIAYSTNGLIVDDTEPSTYYIAVEGINGVEPSFDIEVICPTIDAELIIETASISPGYVESNLANVVFSSSVKNIGNTIAGANVIEYFISDDMIYDDGVDTYIGQDIVPELDLSETCNIETILTMPAGLTAGTKYIVFNVDRADIIVEQDEENIYFKWVQVPIAGILDCSSSVSLTDGVWYYGNTETDGINNVQDYSSGSGLTAPEVIHSFISPYSGLAKLTFTEKQIGQMLAMVLPICNEHTHLASTWFNQPFDTITFEEFYINAGIEYFVVVDGEMPDQGDYGLLIELPDECPSIEVSVAGSTQLCDGDLFPNMWTQWGYSNYQWYKDGTMIDGASFANYLPTEVGSYHVEIIENSCTGASAPVVYSVSSRPDTAQIVSAGPTEFCDGESVVLSLSNTVSFPLQWIRDDEDIAGETANSYLATEPGKYQLVTTNGSCSVKSIDFIDVYVNSLPVDIGEEISIPSDTIEFHYSFDEDNRDEINNYDFWCWDFLPTNDKDDNFWQARDFTSEDYFGESGHYYDMPDEFTLSLWFNTTTIEGGLIANFTDNSWGPTYQEAVIYISDDGKLHYYMSNGGTPAELSSTASYNDGNWHHVLITHDFGMLMEIDGGAEFEQISTAVSHESFSGTWVFAGQTLPADISTMPTSAFFDGKMDELICLNESKYLLRNFSDAAPILDISVIGATEYCDNGLVYFNIENSEYGIEYKVWNNTASAWHLTPGTGTGGDISVGGQVITETTEFLFYAINPTTLCETLLDTSITVSVYPSLPPTISISSDGIEPICAGSTINFTATIGDAGAIPIIDWYYNGVAQSVNSENFSFNGFTDTDTVFAIVWTDYMCPSQDSTISDSIIHTITPTLTPTVSIAHTPMGPICANETLTFVAVPVNCGPSPIYQWYCNGIPVGTNSNIYSDSDFANNDEIYVIVTSDYVCPTVPTAESNHLFTTISIPPQANMLITGGNCIGEEVCMTYTGETAELDHVDWEVIDGGPSTFFNGMGTHCYTPTTSNLEIICTAYNAMGCYDTVMFVNSLLGPPVDINIFDTIYRCSGTLAYANAPVGYDSYLWSNDSTNAEMSTTIAGLYYVTVSNSFGCSDIDSIQIIDYPNNSFNLVSDTSICDDQEITLEINNSFTYDSYYWSDGNTNTWSTEQISIGFMGNNPQFIFVETTDEHCTYSDTIYVHFDDCTYANLVDVHRFDIYPNPAKSFVVFESDIDIYEITIYDVTGKIIYADKPMLNKFIVDVNDWAEAIYYINITTSLGDVLKTRFVKI